MLPALHPSFLGPWRPRLAQRSFPTTFDCLSFFIRRKRYDFERAFFIHRHFLPYVPTFWHKLLLSKFLWEPAVTFLKVAGLHTDPWNTNLGHLFAWFTVIHNLLNFVFMHVILQKFSLVVKTLIKNIDHQPN